ncbi:MAG: thioredoxin [Faecalibacterium sp.]|jgi:thioredoxin 1|nr:thioredoxin [Faecalibacterium sp.]
MEIKTITKENFAAEIEQASQPVLVDLWAPWCVYCRRLAPALDRVAEKYDGQLTVAKINIDEQPELADALHADVIPTLYLYQGGSHGEKLVAPPSQAAVEEWITAQKR